MKIWKLAALALIVGFTGACAQDVGDIDRTQPDALVKADFEGMWYIRDTITDVPATVYGPFVGISSPMEKIRWEITEDALIAYRAHERIPGLDEKAGDSENGTTNPEEGFGQGVNPEEYKEAPIAAYSISQHFDIQRGYNSATGEQSNVISENGSDRPWYERKYFRVNWSNNLITQDYPDFLADFSEYRDYVSQGEGEADSFYEERGLLGEKEDALLYFDFTVKQVYDGDELETVTSFMRLPEIERDYEPAIYDDHMMTKFGYFRTERYTYNQQLGFTDTGVIYLAQRHDMWTNDYQRDAAGVYLRDEEGRRLPTAMEDRTPKPVVYYLNPNFPEDLLSDEGVYGIEKDYNDAFSRAAGAPLGKTAQEINDEYGPMFILCHNPVREDDQAACDPRSEELKTAQENAPFIARPGDVRRSFIFWVHQDQAAGPLGYGPSYADRETGELISGTAYVYGAAVDRSAGSGVDIIRLANGDFTDEQLQNGDDRIAHALANLADTDPRGSYLDLPDSIKNIRLEDTRKELLDEHANYVLDAVKTPEGLEELRTDVLHDSRRQDVIKDSGILDLTIDDEYVRAISDGKIDPSQLAAGDFDEFLTENNPADLEKLAMRETDRQDRLAEQNVYLAEFADPAVMAMAKEFTGETDYDVIWAKIRARLFRGVMAHEVGHTVGLRHNFQGSWDSLNYFDQYWELRRENFRYPETIDDLYETSTETQAQIDGGMNEYSYSSIMDYHSRFNSDFRGLGKYDHAAILFAYTFGTYEKLGTDNKEPIKQAPGFVEVYDDVPETLTHPALGDNFPVREFFHSYDDRYAASQHPLDDLHYSVVVDMVGGVDNITNRRIVHFKDLQQQQKDNDTTRPVEVQYMFGSDEWAEATISAGRWDLGADAFEKVRNEITKFKEYYPLTHFRRDRLEFYWGSMVGRSLRSFQVMPSIYQRWLFDQSGDVAKQNYFLFAALAGLNFLGEALMTPEYGAYQTDNDGNYQLVSLNPEFAEADLRVYPGQGKALYSSYDYDGGYYFFTRITEVGNYWNQIYAILTLAATTQTFVLGESQDARTYSLPYYLVFPSQVTDLFNGFFLNEPNQIAPTAMAGGALRAKSIVPVNGGGDLFDPLTGATIPTAGSEPLIQPRVSFTIRIYSLLYGMLYFTSSYSTDYVNQGRVFKLGNAEQTLPLDAVCAQLGLTTGCSNGTHELSFFNDVSTGVVYGAITPVGGSAVPGMAETLIQRGKVAEAVLNNPLASDTDKQNAARDMENIVEDAVMAAEVSKIADRVL